MVRALEYAFTQLGLDLTFFLEECGCDSMHDDKQDDNTKKKEKSKLVKDWSHLEACYRNNSKFG